MIYRVLHKSDAIYIRSGDIFWASFPSLRDVLKVLVYTCNFKPCLVLFGVVLLQFPPIFP